MTDEHDLFRPLEPGDYIIVAPDMAAKLPPSESIRVSRWVAPGMAYRVNVRALRDALRHFDP